MKNRIRQSASCRHRILVAAIALSMPSHVTAQALPRQGSNADSTSIALHAQLQEMRAERQNLLATVHWSLGLVGAVAFLLVGYSWFTNSRAYERDKEAMQGALKNSIVEELANIRASQSEVAKALRDEMTVTAANVVKGEMTTLSSASNSLRIGLRDLEEEVVEMQIERALEQRHSWAAVSGILKLLMRRHEEGWDLRVSDQLGALSNLLHKEWCRLDADDASNIMAAMDKMSSAHSADAEAIRARVRVLRTPGAAR